VSLKSMTGFGRAAGALPDGTEATVTVRGVNHRFLDVGVKLRDEYAFLEIPVRNLVARTVTRGHVDVSIRTVRPAGRTGSFDEAAAGRYLALWREAAGNIGLPEQLSARDLLGLPGVVRVEENADPDEAAGVALLGIVQQALADFDAARRREGLALAAILHATVGKLEDAVARLDAERSGLAERTLQLLKERLAKLLADVPVDPARLAQEAAILADKADITEEIDRLKAHLVELKRLLDGGGSTGKRLDFLAQELHREANTSGSKARELGATRAVLDLKSLVEAFKEQIQNLE